MKNTRPTNYFEQAHSCRKRAEMLRAIADTVKSPFAADHLRERAKEWERSAAEADAVAKDNPDEHHRRFD